MFCYNCGKEIDDKAVICVHCGVAVNERQIKEIKREYDKDIDYLSVKTGIGVLLGFLGVIGLIIGILMYPPNTCARRTFIKGWVATVVTCILISILIVLFYYILIFMAL